MGLREIARSRYATRVESTPNRGGLFSAERRVFEDAALVFGGASGAPKFDLAPTGIRMGS